MSEGGLVRMADILSPLPAGEAGMTLIWPLVLGLLVAALLLGLRWWRHPLRSLARDLARGRLSSRAAAHCLAQSLGRDSRLRRELDRMRFGRQPPSAATVSQLIRRAASER